MQRAFQAAEVIIPRLRERHWGAEFSPNGRYIGSDSPVVMDGPEGEKVGFKNADVVLYPVSRHVLLRGTLVPVKHPPVKLTHMAAMNTMMLLCADSQIYSHAPDFSWLDEKFKHQTDWRLFSKDHFHGLKLPEG